MTLTKSICLQQCEFTDCIWPALRYDQYEVSVPLATAGDCLQKVRALSETPASELLICLHMSNQIACLIVTALPYCLHAMAGILEEIEKTDYVGS